MNPPRAQIKNEDYKHTYLDIENLTIYHLLT